MIIAAACSVSSRAPQQLLHVLPAPISTFKSTPNAGGRSCLVVEVSKGAFLVAEAGCLLLCRQFFTVSGGVKGRNIYNPGCGLIRRSQNLCLHKPRHRLSVERRGYPDFSVLGFIYCDSNVTILLKHFMLLCCLDDVVLPAPIISVDQILLSLSIQRLYPCDIDKHKRARQRSISNYSAAAKDRFLAGVQDFHIQCIRRLLSCVQHS